jgi:putative NADH-flavin reductase
MKKICVFGADGRTGIEVVNLLVSREYSVTAFVYNSESKKDMPEGVNTISGDVLDYESVDSAVKNNDVVISVLGHIKDSDPFLQTKGMKNIIKSMESNGIKKIISLTGTGVREEGDTPSILDRIANYIIKKIDKERIIDGIEHSKVLKESNLNWTVLRVLKLSKDDEEVNSYNLSEHGPAEMHTSRKKVALIMSDLINDDVWIKKSPISS